MTMPHAQRAPNPSLTDLLLGDGADLQLGRDEPLGLGAAMAGGKGKLATTPRQALDFYPTPPACTRALLIAEAVAIDAHSRRAHGLVWEPCGRGGAIARVLRSAGFAVVAGDIVADPAHDVIAQDIMAVRTAWSPIAITNPPFALAPKMIPLLLGQLGVAYCALLLKTTFWSTNSEDRGRLGLWRTHPPHRRWDLSWRPDFLTDAGGRATRGGSTMNVSWFVWDRNHAGPRTWDLLTPTGPAQSADLFGERA